MRYVQIIILMSERSTLYYSVQFVAIQCGRLTSFRVSGDGIGTTDINSKQG